MNIHLSFDELKTANRLPSPSGTALAIMKLVQQEDATVQQVAKLVQSDPALSGRVLRFANSATFGARRAIVSIQDAIVMMGIHAVRNFALSLSLIGDHLEGSCQGFDYKSYWAQALAMAVALAAITRRKRTTAPEEAFTLGILSDIGRLALATAWPDVYSECLGAASADQLLNLEREHFDIDHEELSSMLLNDWGIPQIFLDALNQSRGAIQPETSRVTRLAQQLAFARSVADYCLADTSDRTAMFPHLIQEANRNGVEENALEDFLAEVVTQWREWGTMIDIQTHPSHLLPKRTPPIQSELKTLLADDDPVLLNRLASQLRANGHQVDICNHGETALQLVVEHNIQMVIVGWPMSSLDGLALCKSLRATVFGKNLYLILLTATESENALVEAFDSGIDDFVTKPVNMRVLLARIRAGQRIIKLQQELWRERKEIEKASAQLALANRRLERIAHTDLLTGLPNRRYALARLEQEWAIAQRSQLPLSVLMMDLDHFKSINDTLGHDAGDIVLAHAAEVISKAKRTGDIACRLGGEEFLVIAANTDDTSALSLAERIRGSIENTQPKKLVLDRPMTISIGVAGSAKENPDWKELIKLADQALYRAKQNGRNSVELATL